MKGKENRLSSFQKKEWLDEWKGTHQYLTKNAIATIGFPITLLNLPIAVKG